MSIDDTAVRELGLDLKHSPTSIELRLPDRVGCASGLGLGFFWLIALLAWTVAVIHAWRAPQHSIGLLALLALAAVAVSFLLRRVVRWLRYGADLRITPDHLVVKKHWSRGEPPVELGLYQVRLEETRRGILVMGGRRKVLIGSALRPGARRPVVEFLTGVIAGYLEPDRERTGDVVVTGEPGFAPHATVSPVFVTTTLAATDEIEAPPYLASSDLLALALCHRFRQFDAGEVHLAPDIPPAVLLTAVRTYLDLQDDEVLLGIVGLRKDGVAGLGCALTTKRIYWPGGWKKAPGSRPPRCRSLVYASLPEAIRAGGWTGSVIRPGGWTGSAIDLGMGRRIGTVASQPIRKALIAFLGSVRSLARGEPAAPAINEVELNAARWAWPRVVAASDRVRALRAEVRTFEGHAHVVSRAVVTPALVLACIVVYALMVAVMSARGGGFTPSHEVMLEWGADFGPSVVFDREFWRLFTAIFLHFGLLHLLFNMYCLATAGPTVERFFGHLAFAGLYVLSGLGGSIASLCVHPTAIGAGASGAIFGVFGALLGFLAIRHRDVPAALLKPMRGGALAFVGYNTIFGLGIPGIDMAAHLGGLFVGFVGGLLLTAVTPGPTRPAVGRRYETDRGLPSIEVAPPRSQGIGGLSPALWRAGILAVLSILLAGLGLEAAHVAYRRMLADPQIGPKIAGQRQAVDAWNAFATASEPLFRDFDRIDKDLDEVTDGVNSGKISDAAALATIVHIQGECRSLGTRISQLPAANGEIQEVRRHLLSAQSDKLQLLTKIEEILACRVGARPADQRELDRLSKAYVREFEAVGRLRAAYFRAHDMQPVEQAP
jgi:rhomboid protease GluP